MKFEILNADNKVVMNCASISCIPEEDQISFMSKSGYKFKLDGKRISKTELIKLKNNS